MPTINELKFHEPNIIYNKVDASNLLVPRAPTSLKQHDTLPPSDKITWHKAYSEGYFGLHKHAIAWECISQSDYLSLRKYTGNVLPTQALAVMKKDEQGQLIRAKYRIVVLGNLDTHNWNKSDCFAPVMSQRLRTGILSINFT